MTAATGLRQPGRAALRRAAAATVGAATLAAAGFIGFVLSLDRTEHDPPAVADAIVALTGGAQRIGDALELLSRGYGSRLLITGVNERTSREEIARLSPGQRQLVACCVDLDYRARNTVGNAEETRRWVRENGFESLIVVTSNYHMPRTMAELNHALPATKKVAHAVVTASADSAGWRTRLASARLLAGEYAKYLAVLAKTHLSPAAPVEPRSERLPRISSGNPGQR